MENNKDSNKPQRDKNGKFLPGNEIGKLPKNKLWSIKELDEAILEVEAVPDKEGKKRDLLKHFVKRAFENDRVLCELIGKNIPKKTITELKNAGKDPFNLFVTQFSGDELPPNLPKEIKEKIEEYRRKLTLKKQGE